MIVINTADIKPLQTAEYKNKQDREYMQRRVERLRAEVLRIESWLTYQFAEPAGWCGFCGRAGHRQIACPDRPLSDFSAGAKKSHKPS